MLRRIGSLTLLVLAVLLVFPVPTGSAVALGSATSARPSAVTATDVLHVSPVTATGALKPGYTITRRFHGGSCESGSEATGDAYRCFAHNFVIDPCWVGTSSSYVICLLAPYRHNVVRVAMKHKHGFENLGGLGSPGPTPWALALPSGERGTLIQGAGEAVDGKRVNYFLSGTSRVLVGNVDRHGAVWRIHEARPTTGDKYVLTGWVKIAKAWFGVRSLKG